MTHIEIGGQKRPVCYNNNALAEFEDLTGQDVLNGLQLSKIKHLNALMFCGLKHGFLEQADYKGEVPFTLTDVGRWSDMADVPAFFEAFRKSRDTGETEEPQEVGEEKKSPGATSEG